jgi:hypothetical protein
MNLQYLKHARHTLQVAEAGAEQAVRRAQAQVDIELSRVRECEQQLAAARDRPSYDSTLVALESAKVDHALALKRLEDSQGEHAHASLEARTAEAMVVKAVDKILTDELAESAKQVERHLDEARRLGLSLRHFAIAAGIHTTGIISAATQQVLDRLGEPLIDLREVPIHLEKLGDVAAFREWVARRDRMITGGTPVQENEAA